MSGKSPGQAITASRWMIRTFRWSSRPPRTWECTATRFRRNDQAHVIVDLVHGISSTATDAAITIENDHCLSGYRRAGGWGGDKVFYFVAEFSKPFESYGLESGGTMSSEKEAKNRRLPLLLGFQNGGSRTAPGAVGFQR